MPEFNKWNVSYSTINYFCNALAGHDKVASHSRSRDILFSIRLFNGNIITVLLVNEYSIGLAAIFRAKKEFPEAEYIVTGGNWNGYTPEAKQYGRDNSLGIYNIGEFFGALNWTEPKKYYQKNADGEPIYAYKNEDS